MTENQNKVYDRLLHKADGYLNDAKLAKYGPDAMETFNGIRSDQVKALLQVVVEEFIE